MTSQTCDLPSNVVLLLICPFNALKTKIFVKKRKSPVASIRKMLLMKDNKYLSWVYGVDRKICHEGH